MITDVVLTYQFLKRFALPFTKWKAYKLGIIDANGRVLKKRSSLVTAEERAALGTFDLIVLNLKRLLAKVPGGGSAVGAMAASVLLMKEESEELAAETFASMLESMAMMEDAPANSAGSGAVAGLGQGPQGEPPAGKGRFKKIRRAMRVWPSRTSQ